VGARPLEQDPSLKQAQARATQARLQTLLKENRGLKAELLRRTRELEHFIRAGKSLAETPEFKKVLRIMLTTSRRLVPCEDWSLLLRSEREDNLYFALVKGRRLEGRKKTYCRVGEGPAGVVAEKGLPLRFPDDSAGKKSGAKWEDFYPHLQLRSLLCLPIVSKNRAIGVIQLVNRLGQAGFSRRDLQLLEKLIDQASLAIERSDIYQKMSDLVTTDDLTHLYNRRYLDHALALEIKRSQRYHFPLSLFFIDLDYFKRVNDTYGHLMGSQVLIEVAQILTENLRAVDVITRYGGDEFVVLLPEISLKGAERVAERLRQAIRAFKFLKKEGLFLQISASFGVAEFPADTEDKTELIHLADQAMYHSKITGRDRVSLASSSARAALPKRP